jgi:hypothetical protein
LCAGDDEEVLGIGVPVQRNGDAGRHDAAQHAEFVGPGEELNGRPKDI